MHHERGERERMDPNNFVLDQSGQFYSARRTFLVDDSGPGGSSNPLQPPADFMTRKQMRNFLRVHKAGGTGLEGLRTLDFQPRDGEGAEQKKGQARSKLGGAHRSKEAVVEVTRFSSTRREDWREELQAGCRMWINVVGTGEVSAQCPYLDDAEAAEEEARAEREEEGGLATGAAAYDSRELDDLFKLLDAAR